MGNPRSTRRYQDCVRALKGRGETQQCWRCGKTLHASAVWPNQQCITLGHIIAYEDDPSLFYEPSNHAPECITCNMGDGARRTNSKRRGNTTTAWHNPNW